MRGQLAKRILTVVIGLAGAIFTGLAVSNAYGASTIPLSAPEPSTSPAVSNAGSATPARPVTAANAAPFDWMQPKTWPSPFNPYLWPFNLFPVPEVATNPNGGVTYGILLAFLFKDQDGHINSIFAPDVNENSELGPGGSLKYFAYPSEDTQWSAIGAAQENIARTVDLNYETGRTHENWWSAEGELFFERDPTERFYGIGNTTDEGNETNYTTEQLYFRALLGWNITHDLQLAFVTKPRYVRIQEGAFTTLPQIFTLFPNVKGINGGSEFYNELRLTYDTRDSIEMPRSGGLGVLYGGNADRALASSVSYNRIGGELARYYSFGKRFTLAMHGYMQYMPAGDETPFWSMGWLGGEPSELYYRETLRGFGAGRFIDNNMTDLNIELRTRVLEASVMGNKGVLEVAPFLDAGQVFHNVSYNPVAALHPAGGIGLRALAEPFVVAYLDVGWGGEGTAIFTGIDYPF
ncbi:MAG TPA: BamA/TamA family outer membrane protein [Candidatus Binataceae bacterium]|nr:BamA/TamA family outer membrane protein [Candidatus Binataceae bacterium]